MSGIEERPSAGESGLAWLGGWFHTLGWPRAPRSKDWLGICLGHELRVQTRGLFRASLAIDGKCLDRRSPLLCTDRTVPFLSGRLPSSRGEVTIVYVYSSAWWGHRIEVRAAGKRVAMNAVP